MYIEEVVLEYVDCISLTLNWGQVKDTSKDTDLA